MLMILPGDAGPDGVGRLACSFTETDRTCIEIELANENHVPSHFSL